VGSATKAIAPNGYFIIVNGPSTFGVTADYDASGAAGGFDLTGTSGGIKIEINSVKLDGLSYKEAAADTIPVPFDTYGEGSVFITGTGNKDFIRSPNGTDTNNNSVDFKRNGTGSAVSPRTANPSI
jgi:hypothetical protein